MQYNFQLRTALSDKDLQEIAAAGPEGLEATSELVIVAKIKTNTELQDEHVENIRQALSSVLEGEAELLSQEH